MSKLPGLKPPSKISKPSGIPKTGIPGTASSSKSTIAARGLGQDVESTPAKRGPEPNSGGDDIIIGDRVWVGGTKPGHIAYIGETQFAPGDWAGVVLDEPVGKNDGSVAGVRYFQCEPKRGVFSKLAKLSKEPPELQPPVMPVTPVNRISMAKSGATNGNASKMTAPKSGLARRTSTGSSTNLSKTSPAGSMTNLHADTAKMKAGDRVLVSGSKAGILRFIGGTEFAKGEWAGVELDEPLGKNDGAVAGKRYFSCKPLFGLFAPIHKVARVSGGGDTSTRRSSISKLTGLSSLSRERSGSQDSVSSISSTASSLSRSRVRLGVTSLNSQQKTKVKSYHDDLSSLPSRTVKSNSPANKTPGSSQRPSSLNLSATTSALQRKTSRSKSSTLDDLSEIWKALKEKEEHIEQLLRERDMERSEVARAAAQVDEAENQLLTLRNEHEKYMEENDESMTKLKTLITKLEKEKVDIYSQMEEEKRKVEDLQFRMEEEEINKDDLTSKMEDESSKIASFEKALKEERAKNKALDDKVKTLKELYEKNKVEHRDAEDSAVAYLDQIEELTHKLSQAENKIKVFEETKSQVGAKAGQLSEAINEKNAKISDLEQMLHNKTKDMKSTEAKLNGLTEELQEAKRKSKKQQDNIDDLMVKLAKNDSNANNLNTEMQTLRSQVSDLQRQLEASEAKSEQLSNDKAKLENQIAELMKNSGDSSQQLSLMNEQLRERDRKLEEIQDDLLSSSQTIARLSEQYEQLREKAGSEMDLILLKHQEDFKIQQEKFNDLQNDLDTANAKMTKLTKSHKQEIDDVITEKDKEVNQMKLKLSSNSDSERKLLEVVETARQKELALATERDNVKFDKEKLEKLVKKLEQEKDALEEEKSKVEFERDELELEKKEASSEKGSAAEKVTQLTVEKQQLVLEKEQLVKARDTLKGEKEAIQKEKEDIMKEKYVSQASLEERNTRVKDLENEVGKLKQESNNQLKTLDQMRSELGNVAVFRDKFEELKQKMEDLQFQHQESEIEQESLLAEINRLKHIEEDKISLEKQQTALRKQIEEMTSKIRGTMEGFEAERASMQTSLETTTKLLKQREKELEKQRSEINNLQTETSRANTYRQTAQNYEKDNKNLKDRLSQLEKTLAESKANANIASNVNTRDTVVAKLQDDKVNAEGQVAFLNSVIVDIQRKNEDLQARLQAMESGVLNGSDLGESPPLRHSAPRLFCDICDVFDLHDTEDCPKQTMSDYETPEPHHPGVRGEERPYCDICESKTY
ncbi:CAP-Gly domain-containing linker protein 1-like isoform X4 [Lineus longissimus]|uniref:CAP-Gly domain-containing linker protein 1-like isoform X4 n=1 Tax=Lineus longissimus TaxID=88925 RepID=UPI00315CE34F